MSEPADTSGAGEDAPKEAVGKSQVATDVLDPTRIVALFVALGLEGKPPGHYDPLPPYFHQVYFWDVHRPDELGRDGLPHIGGDGFIPDLGLPRRMWAGGRLTFYGPLRQGLPAQKTSTIEKVQLKKGRSGPLAFVTLRHDIVEGGMLRVTEYEDLVYLPDPDRGRPRPPAPVAPETWEDAVELTFTPTLLFRYSALTLNGHRIHYDREYCQRVEGYPGLVVQGQLLAQFLMLRANAHGTIRHFSMRAYAPVFDFETVQLCRAGDRYWIRGEDGRLAVMGEAVFAPGAL
ncbi:acyl dehydratase [Rhodovulum sulfidophilum]|uniref:acyl dehydratase n=1 Tax=Rhodovulum sulfidophilum TaxID=35806 RepID=UPI001EE3FD54|nr:acyl dehydratase [Rhodovulum sulfidophilum]